MKPLLLLVVMLFAEATAGAPYENSGWVSMIQLIANPERHDGKLVAVTGFLHLQFESDALYLHEDDYKHVITENSLWVERTPEMAKDEKKLSGNYVVVVGIFKSGRSGRARHPAALVQIKRCELWSEPAHPRVQKYKDLVERNP